MTTRSRSALLIPADQMQTAIRPEMATNVEASLLFGAADVNAAVRWADKQGYNYADLGELLLQWALSGSPGGGGPDIDESSYRFYRSKP